MTEKTVEWWEDWVRDNMPILVHAPRSKKLVPPFTSHHAFRVVVGIIAQSLYELHQDQWHQVKDALPEEGERVLVEIHEELADNYFDVWSYDSGNQYWNDGTVIRWKRITA